MPTAAMTYKKLRTQLDDLGYFQPLVPEASPLVEALLHDLLATTHNLKICKEKQSCQSISKKNEDISGNTGNKSEKILENKDLESSKIIGLQHKVKDLELLYKESLEVIKSLHVEIEERNKKILKLELSHKAQIVTEKDKPIKPRIELTSLVSNESERSISTSGPTYDQVPDQSNRENRIDVVKIYAKKNQSLEKEIHHLQDELKTTKDMLNNVEKYWSQQALLRENDTQIQNQENCDPTKSTYAMKLLKENDSLKEKLNHLESQAPVCFHGKCVPPNAPGFYQHGQCPEAQIRSSIEQSHAHFQSQQQNCPKSQVNYDKC